MFAGRNLQSSNSPPEEHFFSTRMPSCPAALVHYGRFFFVDNSDNSFYHALGLLSSATSCKSPQCNHHAYCFGDFNTPLEKLHFINPIFLGLGFVWVSRDLFFLRSFSKNIYFYQIYPLGIVFCLARSKNTQEKKAFVKQWKNTFGDQTKV